MLEKNINRVERTTLSQDIVQQLMTLIVNGDISPGEKLPSERKLMELFGVGRSTMREAIQALSALGLVEVKVPLGTFVPENFDDFFTKHLALMSKISFDNILELIEARTLLEMDLAEIAAEKSNEEDHHKLDHILLAARKSEGNEEFIKYDMEFHATIAEIANNSFLLHMLNILQGVTKEWMHKVIKLHSPFELVIEQHQKIADAIKCKDKELARAEMKKHLSRVSNLLLEIQNGK